MGPGAFGGVVVMFMLALHALVSIRLVKFHEGALGLAGAALLLELVVGVLILAMEIFVFLGFLINAAMILAAGVVIIAIWYGMKALVKMANSVARMANAVERIEETIKRNDSPRV